MLDTLPPLKALRAFVAAARHESFLEAGEELNVSPGAISRHVKILEGFLNSSLFLRRSNGVVLTGSGQIYLEKTEPILIALSEVTQSFLAETEDQALVISTLPIFAEKWLGPHLPAFRKLHPRIRLRIDNRDGIDARFRPDIEAKLSIPITRLRMFRPPVCLANPSYLFASRPFARPSAKTRCPRKFCARRVCGTHSGATTGPSGPRRSGMTTICRRPN